MAVARCVVVGSDREMLTHLHIRNLAVIEDVSVEFGSGLNVLTGETGAGKSILIDALALLSGVRATSDLIRKGTDRLTVTGIFRPSGEAWIESLTRAGLAVEDDAIVIRREVTRDGPNRVFVNDEPVTLKLLTRIAPLLLRIHAQREELNLVSPEFQRQLLDRSGGKSGERILAATAGAFEKYRELLDRWRRLAGDEKARLERLDLLRFQRQEIDAAKVVEGEEDELRTERDVLRHSEAIRQALGESVNSLFEDEGSAAERMATSARALGAVAEWEPRSAEWATELEELRIRLEDMSRDVAKQLQQLSADPGRLDEIEDRLALLERLFRKYGATSGDVVEYRKKIGLELDELTMDDESRQGLEAEMAASLDAYSKQALELTSARKKWGESLASDVERELADLAMARARFSVELGTRPRTRSPLLIDGAGVEFGASGVDEIAFELAANPGEAKGSLAAVASGGELSRVYLALRLAVGVSSEVASAGLVFDEIDSGIGGAEAAALGQKLRRLADSAQVFAVTHLAQVASHGHRHYRVRKTSQSGRTKIAVDPLDREARVEEIARMLAGKKVTELSRSHARELLEGAQ
jgi:DNA repair protein RecN (Recombination protein N)